MHSQKQGANTLTQMVYLICIVRTKHYAIQIKVESQYTDPNGLSILPSPNKALCNTDKGWEPITPNPNGYLFRIVRTKHYAIQIKVGSQYTNPNGLSMLHSPNEAL
jgi:hypothetical protein